MMKYLLTLALLIVIVVLLTIQTIANPGGAKAPDESSGGVQVIEVTAKKYEFDPSPIRVKRGSKVQLKITATDHAHGFRIDSFAEGVSSKSSPGLVFSSPKECYKIEQHMTETIEFTAQVRGTYDFKCCVHCGIHHRSMKGELIVEP